jgi:NitT/TauT family transport system substrate-binding protein
MFRSAFTTSALSLFAALSYERAALAQTQPLNLRVAATPNDSYGSAYYALDAGFFARAGLNVDLESMLNGATIAAAVTGGTIDVGVATPIAIANAYLHDVPLTIVAAGSIGMANVHTLGGVCVSKSSGINLPKDLEGKTVAVTTLKTGSEVSFDVWLIKGGGDLAKVKLIELPFSEMGTALDRGTIAAAVISQPSLDIALKQHNIRILADPNLAIAPRFMTSCWFSTRQFAQQNAEAIRRFQRAIYDTQKWANAHRSETAVILAKYTKADVDLIRTSVRAPFAEELRLSDIQPYLDAAAKTGSIARPVVATNIIYQP